jgi:hypothetical protein
MDNGKKGKYIMDNFFIITSYGRTATYWIAKVLTMHPDILCAHGPTTDFYHDYKQQSLEAIDLQKIHKNIANFYKLSLSEYLNLLKKSGEAKFYGSCHAYSAGNFLNKIKEYNKTLQFVNLIRHPITRIESHRNKWLREVQKSKEMRKRLEEQFYQISRKDSFVKRFKNTKIRDKYFICALNSVLSQDKWELAKDVWHVPMEKLTKDRETFIWIINHLTHGQIVLSNEYLEQVFDSKKVNHTQIINSNSYMCYSSWDRWEKDYFKSKIGEYGYSQYSDYNYDFSFIDNRYYPNQKNLLPPLYSSKEKPGSLRVIKYAIKKLIPKKLKKWGRKLIIA